MPKATYRLLITLNLNIIENLMIKVDQVLRNIYDKDCWVKIVELGEGDTSLERITMLPDILWTN